MANLFGQLFKPVEELTFVNYFMDMLSKLPEEKRLDVLYQISRRFCVHCGEETNGRTCHCRNDE